MAGWLANKVSSFVDGIVSAFTGNDGIDAHSPSRLFAKFGGYMAQGIGEGFTSGMADGSRQITNRIPSSVEMSGRYSANGAYGSTTINDGGINLYIGTLNNSNDRDIQDVARVLEFQRQQKSLARGVVTA